MSKVRFGTIVNFLNAKRKPLSSKERENKSGIYPYYGASDIVDYIDEYIFNGTYLLISEDGENLKSRKTPIAFIANGKFWVNNHAHIVEGKDDETIDYLKYYFSQLDLSPYITGAVQPKLSKGVLEKIEIDFPSYEIRKSINQILGLLDDKIQLNTQTNQTLEAIAQVIFKSWFVDFDPVRAKAQAILDGKTSDEANLSAMAVISGKTIEDLSQTEYQELWEIAEAFPSELVENEQFGEVPKGWEIVGLSSLFEFIGGSQPPKSEHIYNEQEGYERFIQNRDYSNENHITYIPISKKNKRCNEKDILMDKYGEAGKVRFGIKGAYNVALAKIQPKAENLREFLRGYFMQDSVMTYLHMSSIASTRNSLNSSSFAGLNIVIPNDMILDRFEEVVSTHIDAILKLKTQNKMLAKTRDLLLPRLLSGELLNE